MKNHFLLLIEIMNLSIQQNYEIIKVTHFQTLNFEFEIQVVLRQHYKIESINDGTHQ